MDRRRQSLMALALERDLRTHLRINLLPRCDAMDEYYCVALLCVEIETKILTKKEVFKNIEVWVRLCAVECSSFRFVKI